MNNNTNQATNSKRGTNNTADFKPKRRNVKKENIGLGGQPVSLKDCNYGWSANGIELVKLDFEHLDTSIIETFNFINGSAALDIIMDVLDETGELDIDFKDYIGKKMNVEVVEAGKFRNIINAWAITMDEHENTSSSSTEEHDEDEEDNYYYGEDEPEDDELDLRDFLSDGGEE